MTAFTVTASAEAAARAASIASSATAVIRRPGGTAAQISGPGAAVVPVPSRIRITCRSQQTANRRCRLQQCSHAQYRPGCTRNARDDFFFTVSAVAN